MDTVLVKGKKLAMRFLATRMYSAREVYDRLRRNRYSSEDAEEIVSELIQEGVLDDRRYTEYYILDSINIGYKGIYRIKQELRRKGVAGSVVELVLANNDFDTLSSLREYVEKRLRVTEISSRRDYEKFRASLARRGYSISEINDVLSEYEFDI